MAFVPATTSSLANSLGSLRIGLQNLPWYSIRAWDADQNTRIWKLSCGTYFRKRCSHSVTRLKPVS